MMRRPVMTSMPGLSRVSVFGGRGFGARGWLAGLAAMVVLGCLPAGAWAAAPEAPLTEAPGSVTGTTATFNGELNPGSSSEAVFYRFVYSAGVGAECAASGVTAPGEPPFPEAEGNHTKVSLPVTGLEGSTTYSVCLIAINAGEEATQGTQEVFTTPAAKPVVVAERTQGGSVGAFDAALEAELNPENLAGFYHFEYSTSNTLAGAKSVGEAALPKSSEVQGSGPVDIGGGLTPGTVYYYRVVATNSTGTTMGPIEHFETQSLQAPVISEVPAVGLGQTTAFVSALIDPEFQETTGKFEYGLTEGYGSELAFGPFGGPSSGSAEDIGANLESLTANTVYHYRVSAENPTGPTESPDETFVTLPNPPVATTGEATPLSSSSEQVAGVVNPENTGQPGQDATTYLFQYGRTPSYGSQSPASPGEIGEGTSPVPETATLEGLEAGVLYHYRVIATNDSTGTPQTVYGDDQTFTTLANPRTPPALGAVTAVASETEVTVFAALLTRNLPTRYELSVGTTQGALTPVAAGRSSTSGVISLTAVHLAPGTVYHYVLLATGADGPAEVTGEVKTLPAPAPPPQSVLPPVIPALTIAELDAKEAVELKGIHSHPVSTRAELLTKALKKCRKLHSKHGRQVCERKARKRYPTAKKKH